MFAMSFGYDFTQTHDSGVGVPAVPRESNSETRPACVNSIGTAQASSLVIFMGPTDAAADAICRVHGSSAAPFRKRLFVKSFFRLPSIPKRVTSTYSSTFDFSGRRSIDVVEALGERKVVCFAAFAVVVEQELPDVGAIGRAIIVPEHRKAFALACERWHEVAIPIPAAL